MKRSELEKQLYIESETHLPDVYDSVLSAADEQELFVKNNTAKRRSRIPWFRIAATFAAAAACCAIVVPAILLRNTRPSPAGVGTAGSPALSSAADTLGLGAVTTVRLLGGAGAQQKSVAKISLCSYPEDAVKEQSDYFNKYFSILESFLGDDGLTSTVSANTDEGYIGYDYKLTVTGYGFVGDVNDYVMYYNETVIKDENSSKNIRQEVGFSGVMLSDGKEYALEGKRSYKEERDEREEQFEIRAYPDVNVKDTYVKMEQEYSVEDGETEHEYVYRVYENGELVEETCVEFEHEVKGDKEETELKIEFRQGEAKGSYKLERDVKDGYEVMKVRYDLEGASGEFYVSASENGYEYDYADGTKKHYKTSSSEKLRLL